MTRERLKPGDLVKLAETFLGGGTNYTSPLQKAVSIIEENSRYRKADVVFYYRWRTIRSSCIKDLHKPSKWSFY